MVRMIGSRDSDYFNANGALVHLGRIGGDER